MGALLVYILGTEKLISKELRSLFDMKVFPTQELLLIRKDLKAFKEKIANTKIDHKGNEIVERRASGQGQGQGQVSHSILDTDFNNSLTNCLSEQLLAERKLNLLTERRKHEEDARISHAKKMARIRAAQKTQSRDPSSFANQKRF